MSIEQLIEQKEDLDAAIDNLICLIEDCKEEDPEIVPELEVELKQLQEQKVVCTKDLAENLYFN